MSKRALEQQLQLLQWAQLRAQGVQGVSLFCLPKAKSTCLQHLPTRNRDPLSTAAMLLSSWPYVWRHRTYINEGSSVQSDHRSAQQPPKFSQWAVGEGHGYDVFPHQIHLLHFRFLWLSNSDVNLKVYWKILSRSFQVIYFVKNSYNTVYNSVLSVTCKLSIVYMFYY